MVKNRGKKVKVVLLMFLLAVVAFFLIRLFMPTWTRPIKGVNSISEMKKVEINNTKLQVMMRGYDKDNPVILFVHGGPCCSDIPLARKYQKELEKDFTIVHYDQRGSGKSYRFFADYSDVDVATHVEDLVALAEYVEAYLEKEKVILMGHSFGTYIGTLAADARPDLFSAYIGIGQISDSVAGEIDNLERCKVEALKAENDEDVKALDEALIKICEGEEITPRNYLRKYGMACRQIDDNADYTKAFLFGTEYNLLDGIRFLSAASKYQGTLIKEEITRPLPQMVTEAKIPFFFVMGKYDGMTSPSCAEDYLNSLGGDAEKKFVLFEASAHYPQFEEPEKFNEWMRETFR